MGLGSLIDAAATVWRIPDVDGERCVHSLMETAQCRRCLDACPRNAWVMDDDLLGIDMEACDGCGLCIPACPEGAVRPDYLPAVRTFQQESIAFLACELAIDTSAPGRIPCVHAVGERELVGLYRRGVARCFVSRGDCASCPRSSARPIDDHAAMVNSVLKGRGSPAMVLVDLPRDQWLALQQRTTDATVPAVNRRDFLRRAGAQAADTAAQRWLPSGLAEEARDPPGRILPRVHPGEPTFHVPLIDVQRCNGCDACARLCPHQAIRLGEDATVYFIDADLCTGCRVCVDACDRGAVEVRSGTVQHQPEVALAVARCRACGVSFHQPADQGKPADRCRICSATDYHSKLFQVMD